MIDFDYVLCGYKKSVPDVKVGSLSNRQPVRIYTFSQLIWQREAAEENREYRHGKFKRRVRDWSENPAQYNTYLLCSLDVHEQLTSIPPSRYFRSRSYIYTHKKVCGGGFSNNTCI